jgi:CHASE3 domain sensor protein
VIHKKYGNLPQNVSNIESKINETQKKMELASKTTLDQLRTMEQKIADKLAEMNDRQDCHRQQQMDVTHRAKTRSSKGADTDVNLTTEAPPDTHHGDTDDVLRPYESARPKETENQVRRDNNSRENERRGNTAEKRLSTPVTKQERRRILLIGDSTTKLVDKRQLLKQETISKCRAATVNDANVKISTGGSHEMDKIVFCVGLNDLRDGKSVNQVVEDMKYLIDETIYRHPRSIIYVCSILMRPYTDTRAVLYTSAVYCL